MLPSACLFISSTVGLYKDLRLNVSFLSFPAGFLGSFCSDLCMALWGEADTCVCMWRPTDPSPAAVCLAKQQWFGIPGDGGGLGRKQTYNL